MQLRRYWLPCEKRARSLAAATKTLPPDTVSFTDRWQDPARLREALAPKARDGVVAGIHAIGGIVGIGKTTFALHAARQWSAFPMGSSSCRCTPTLPGGGPSTRPVLASPLLIAGIAEQQIPPGLEARAAPWGDHVAGKKILPLPDNAARAVGTLMGVDGLCLLPRVWRGYLQRCETRFRGHLQPHGELSLICWPFGR